MNGNLKTQSWRKFATSAWNRTLWQYKRLSAEGLQEILRLGHVTLEKAFTQVTSRTDETKAQIYMRLQLTHVPKNIVMYAHAEMSVLIGTHNLHVHQVRWIFWRNWRFTSSLIKTIGKCRKEKNDFIEIVAELLYARANWASCMTSCIVHKIS